MSVVQKERELGLSRCPAADQQALQTKAPRGHVPPPRLPPLTAGCRCNSLWWARSRRAPAPAPRRPALLLTPRLRAHPTHAAAPPALSGGELSWFSSPLGGAAWHALVP